MLNNKLFIKHKILLVGFLAVVQLVFMLIATSAYSTCNFTIKGDTDRNGVVNASDLFPIAQNYGMTSTEVGFVCDVDTNEDGIINASDLFAVAQNYGMTAPVSTCQDCPSRLTAKIVFNQPSDSLENEIQAFAFDINVTGEGLSLDNTTLISANNGLKGSYLSSNYKCVYGADVKRVLCYVTSKVQAQRLNGEVAVIPFNVDITKYGNSVSIEIKNIQVADTSGYTNFTNWLMEGASLTHVVGNSELNMINIVRY